MAHLSNSRTLHVHSQTIGKLRFDVRQNSVVSDELIARANQTAVNLRGNSIIFRHFFCHCQKMFSTSKARRQTLHLTIKIAFAAPHVVISRFCTHHHVHHAQLTVNATSTTRINDGFRRKTRNQLRSSNRSIHLANATLHQHNIVLRQLSRCIGTTINQNVFTLFQQSRYLRVFFRHSRDNS